MVSALDLIREYKRVMHLLGRHPTLTDLDEHSRYSSSTFIRRLGSWPAVRKAMGDDGPRLGKVGREQLLLDFHRVTALLGRHPTGSELDKLSNFGRRTYHKYFGGHANVVRAAKEWKPEGLSPLAANSRVRLSSHAPPIERHKAGLTVRSMPGIAAVTPTHLKCLRHFCLLEELLGKPPTLEQVLAHSPCSQEDFAKCFGSWRRFIKAIYGATTEQRVPARANIGDALQPDGTLPAEWSGIQKELASVFIAIERDLGRAPTIREIEALSGRNARDFFVAFGGYGAFLRYMRCNE